MSGTAVQTGYAERTARLSRGMRTASDVRLRKSTSNLFRDRARHTGTALDCADFQHVLDIDTEGAWVDAEGMTPYDVLLEATLARGTMPCVVPQLRSITIGGALAGVGIESSSFRYGLVHETVREVDVLLADGDVVTCTPDNEHRDLFHGLANSYGTLGYALRVRAATRPVQPFVRLTHRRFDDADAFFAALRVACEGDFDFLDGVVFAPRDLVLTGASFVPEAPYTSDYSYEHIYYRSLRERDTDYLATRDYLWRWDTDWFWCSKNLFAQNPLVRRLLGRERLNSRFYQRVMRWNSRWRVTHALTRLSGRHRESVIQDVDLPLANAAEFLDFLHREIGILPIWVCPIRPLPGAGPFVLYPLQPGTTYVNFGFWDTVRTRERHPPGHFNRLVEARVEALGGIKSLYSESYYTRQAFWRNFDYGAYSALKQRYDPAGKLPGLYEKCVGRSA